MFTYIKRSVPGFYLTLLEELKAEEYNNIGSTLEDFNSNMFVLLNDEQLAFKEENPNASVREVFNMEMDKAPERTLEEAKREMLSRINQYDYSDNVNSFTINGSISAWFTVQERLNYQRSVDAALSLNEDAKLKFFVNDMLLEVPAKDAKNMLSAIQLYADECFIVTKQHKIEVQKLDTIEEVDGYDYRANYPERLNFNL